MFFNSSKKKQKILQINDDFAVLEAITSGAESASVDPKSRVILGNLQFVFSYRISQLKAIEESATKVRITVKTQSNAGRPVIIKSKRANESNNNNVIDRILTRRSTLSSVNKQEQILCEKYSDVTSRINNKLLDALRTGQEDLSSLGLRKQKLSLKTVEEIIENNLQSSVIYSRTNRELDIRNNISLDVSSDSVNERELYHKMMLQGQSPSIVEYSDDRFISTYESSAGLLKPRKKEVYSSNYFSDVLTNFLLFNNSTSRKDIKDKNIKEKLTVLEDVVDNSILLRTRINLKSAILDLDSPIVVKFELLQKKKNSSGEMQETIIENIEKSFNPHEHVSLYFTPIRPPAVRISKDRTNNYLNFSVTQKDKRADSIKIYKKIINGSVYSDYSIVDEIKSLVNTGPINLKYLKDNSEFCIYRFVPFSTNNREYLPCQFTDVVIKEKKKYKHLVLIPQLEGGGIRIHVDNKDPMIFSARLLVRDITSKKSTFFETGKTFNFSKNSTKTSEFLTGFQENSIYEFTTKIQLKSGEEIDSSHIAMIEFLPYDASALSVTFSNVTGPGSTSNDVQMNINATLQMDQIGQIDQLRNLVSKSYSSDDSRKAIFDKYVFFNIIRYDVTTGEECDLGVILNGDTFIDSLQSSKFNAPSIMQDRSYRYIVIPLIRDPESFEESVEKKDDITRKSYVMSPKKHIHPFALKKGTLFSKNFIDNDSKHAALYNKLGVNYSFEIDNVISLPSITNFSIEKKNNKVLLSWEVQGVISKIDHFLILKEIDHVRKILGKSHAVTSSLVYHHELSYSDVGNTKYILVPVYSDYSIGAFVYSDDIVIEESDIKIEG